jgi:hypothetical protein
MFVGGVGGLALGHGGDAVEVDVAEAAAFFLVECDQGGIALETHRLTADLGAEGGVLVALVIAEHEPCRAGPARNFLG